MGQHLLETVTSETVSSFAKRNIGGGGGASSAKGGVGGTLAIRVSCLILRRDFLADETAVEFFYRFIWRIVPLCSEI